MHYPGTPHDSAQFISKCDLLSMNLRCRRGAIASPVICGQYRQLLIQERKCQALFEHILITDILIHRDLVQEQISNTLAFRS